MCTRTKTGLRGIKVDSHGNQLSEFSHDSLRIVLSSFTGGSNDGTPCFYFILLNFSDVNVCRQKILLFISQWAQWAHPLWNTMCRCVLRVQPTGVKPSKKRWNAMQWSIVSITPGLRKSKRWYNYFVHTNWLPQSKQERKYSRTLFEGRLSFSQEKAPMLSVN